MDIELFQWVLLGLLALGVIVLVALLATLGGIRKALEQRSGAGAATADAAPSDIAPAAGTASTPDTQDTAAEDAAAEAVASSTDAAPSADSGTYPPAEQAAAPAATGRADTIRSVLEQHGLSQSEAQPAAAAEQSSTEQSAQPEDTHVVDSVFAAHADDPQEEPFQRDGRWWFRRGDELLLYDEPSGQWQPAPSDSPAATAAAPQQATATATAPADQSAGVETTPVSTTPAVADQVATFWKCPTCGAVNGSTAATCRMCFAARP